ncbi:MAG: hypothetical protein V4456_08900 [Bacteroidota bacterium]
MRIKPAENEGDAFKDLTPLEQKTRKAAIVLAFVGVFCWAVKILFL